ncbi:MAG: LPS export ABC transporter permease LptG [Burkholderiales bacterium]|jgi:lipopolysaccharide export system permease protein|nr:LPS export ABC transporter permease LptG [Burkholderiales bacterium]
MNTLQRYLWREISLASLFLVFALVLIFAFFDVINELGDIGHGRSLSSVFLYVLLKVPSRFYELAPVAALIGTLYVLAQLVANSEFTVMRVSGMSLSQVCRAIIQVGIPIALVTFLAGEFLSPPADRIAHALRSADRSAAKEMIAQQFSSGFWFKENNTFANIRAATASHVLMDVFLYEFDDQMKLQKIRTAKRAIFLETQTAWEMEGVVVTDFIDGNTKVYEEPEYLWKTVLRPSILTVYQIPPEQLELKTLFDNIGILQKSAQDTARFEVALWVKIVYPINVFVMMLLTLPFAQFQSRQSGIGIRLFVGAMLGLTFFLVGRLFSYLGVLNHWSPLISAFTPSVLFLVLTFCLLYRQERK